MKDQIYIFYYLLDDHNNGLQDKYSISDLTQEIYEKRSCEC